MAENGGRIAGCYPISHLAFPREFISFIWFYFPEAVLSTAPEETLSSVARGVPARIRSSMALLGLIHRGCPLILQLPRSKVAKRKTVAFHPFRVGQAFHKLELAQRSLHRFHILFSLGLCAIQMPQDLCPFILLAILETQCIGNKNSAVVRR